MIISHSNNTHFRISRESLERLERTVCNLDLWKEENLFIGNSSCVNFKSYLGKIPDEVCNTLYVVNFISGFGCL